jgi:hypothetical protein
MTATISGFKGEQAPCGRVVDGERHRDQDDDECLVSDDVFYDCGCRVIRHEYHDGGTHRQVVHHDGKVLVDERGAEHHV